MNKPKTPPCVECRWCVKFYASSKYSKCLHESSGKYNVVNGKRELYFCENMRMLSHGECEHFEPKSPKKPLWRRLFGKGKGVE